MKRIVLLLLAFALLACGCASPAESKPAYGITDRELLTDKQRELMEKYPQYFGIDATNGLDVIVWQMTEKLYSFGLLEHSEEERKWLSEELLNLKGTRAEDMKAILETYPIPRDKIHIIPWQNPISSYIGDHWVVNEGEDLSVKQEAYIKRISEMLFS